MNQVIIVASNSYNSMTEFANIVNKASSLFMDKDFMHSAYPYEKYDSYSCISSDRQSRKIYTNPILDELSYNNFMLGKSKFYVKETFVEGKLVAAEEVDDYLAYECVVTLDQDVYEEWICTGKSMLVYEHENIEQMIQTLKTKHLVENQDFFILHSNNEVIAIGCKPLPDVINYNITQNLNFA